VARTEDTSAAYYKENVIREAMKGQELVSKWK